MAKFQFKVEVKPLDGDPTPTIDEVEKVIREALADGFPDAEVKAYDGERTDID